MMVEERSRGVDSLQARVPDRVGHFLVVATKR